MEKKPLRGQVIRYLTAFQAFGQDRGGEAQNGVGIKQILGGKAWVLEENREK